MSDAKIEALLRDGVTGDLIQALIDRARHTSDANPGSVFAYAVWSVCWDLSQYFEDEQGIPVSEWARINLAIRNPLTELIQTGGLTTESPASTDALVRLLRALHLL